MRILTLLFILFAQTALAQGSIKVTNGSGAILRILDRLSGNVADFKVTNGEIITLGNISVLMKECRYPSQSIDIDAFAYLAIRSFLKLPISFPTTTGCKEPSTGGVTVKNF